MTASLPTADAFDDAWVRTPTSMDVIYDSFAGLLGRQTNSKNDVVQGVSWRFTGKRNDRYAFSGVGSG